MYKYYLNARPAMPGAVPKGFMQIDEQDKGGRYGAIYYEIRLKDEDIEKYELCPALTKEQENFLKIYTNRIAAYWYFYYKKEKLTDLKDARRYSKWAKDEQNIIFALNEVAQAIGITKTMLENIDREQRAVMYKSA